MLPRANVKARKELAEPGRRRQSLAIMCCLREVRCASGRVACWACSFRRLSCLRRNPAWNLKNSGMGVDQSLKKIARFALEPLARSTKPECLLAI